LQKREEQSGHKINRQIRSLRVRVIDDEGNQLGILSIQEALSTARYRGHDLVEVSPLARPPVCKIMDYGKFEYQQKKKTQEAKRNQKVIQIKEIKLRPKTDNHDRETKLRRIKEFLDEGNKVKVTMRFRGREIVYAEKAMEMLFKIGQDVQDQADIEHHPNLMGRNMSMVLAPKTKKCGSKMPKMKTHRSSAKRLRITKRGKVVAHHAFASHLLTHKNRKRKRNLKKGRVLETAAVRNIHRVLPYG